MSEFSEICRGFIQQTLINLICYKWLLHVVYEKWLVLVPGTDWTWFILMWHYEVGVAKQTIFLFALGRNQTKARARGLDATGSGQGNTDQRGVGKRNPEKAVGEGWRRESGVDNGQQKEAVREGQSGWVGIPSSFVDISLEIHASVSLQMHRECNVMEPPFLHFELIEALICSFVLFLPLPRLYSCDHKEMCDTPIGTTRWITGPDRIVLRRWCNSGQRGIVTLRWKCIFLIIRFGE